MGLFHLHYCIISVHLAQTLIKTANFISFAKSRTIDCILIDCLRMLRVAPLQSCNIPLCTVDDSNNVSYHRVSDSQECVVLRSKVSLNYSEPAA